MQQAITDGNVQEMKELINEYGQHIVNDPEPSGLSPVMRCVDLVESNDMAQLLLAAFNTVARSITTYFHFRTLSSYTSQRRVASTQEGTARLVLRAMLYATLSHNPK